jgi:hypothetical protein
MMRTDRSARAGGSIENNTNGQVGHAGESDEPIVIGTPYVPVPYLVPGTVLYNADAYVYVLNKSLLSKT